MALFKVYRLQDGTLTTDPTDYPIQEFDFIGEFFADAQCDFWHNMIKLNVQEGRCDKSLTELEARIEKEGL